MADDGGRIYFFDNHFNDAVVYQNVYARFYVTGQILERDAADLFVTQHIICCQCIGIACFDGDRLVIHKASQTNLRSSGVHQRCNGKSQFFPQACDLFKPLFMRCMVSVGKVKSCHIHAGKHDLPHDRIVICRRSDRTNNLRLSHITHASFNFLMAFLLTVIV